MIRVLFLILFASTSITCLSQEEGRSGVIKIRKPGSQHYFVDINDAPLCLQVTPETPIPEFAVRCSDCANEAGLLWLKITINKQGDVDLAIPEIKGDPKLDMEAVTFARSLRFEPYEIDGTKRAVRFLFPVRFYLP